MARIIIQAYESTRGGVTDRPQPHRFRAVSLNGKKLALGEGYANPGDRDDTIRLLFDPATEVIVTWEDGTEEQLR